jgi:hypothetical protein
VPSEWIGEWVAACRMSVLTERLLLFGQGDMKKKGLILIRIVEFLCSVDVTNMPGRFPCCLFDITLTRECPRPFLRSPHQRTLRLDSDCCHTRTEIALAKPSLT